MCAHKDLQNPFHKNFQLGQLCLRLVVHFDLSLDLLEYIVLEVLHGIGFARGCRYGNQSGAGGHLQLHLQA